MTGQRRWLLPGAIGVLLIILLGAGCGAGDEEENQVNSANQEPEENGTDDLLWVTEEVEGERLEFHILESDAADRQISYHVFVPLPYETQSDQDFPVLYWLHGSGAGTDGIRPLSMQFAQAMQSGQMPVMLVVFPNGLQNGMWVDWKDGSVPMETIIIEELIPEIDATYRTVAEREGRLIEGFSMGGYGAARLGLKYPDLFWGMSILGAGPMQEVFDETPRANEEMREQVFQDVYGGDMDYFRQESPWVLAEEFADHFSGDMRIRIALGEDDELLENNRLFRDRLAALEIDYEYREIEDVGHDPMELRQRYGEDLWEFYR